MASSIPVSYTHLDVYKRQTILSSMGAASDHLDHVKTQLPYSIAVAVLSIVVGYIPVAAGLSIWIVLPLSMVVTALFEMCIRDRGYLY